MGILLSVWKIVNTVGASCSVNKYIALYWHVTKQAVPFQVNDLMSQSAELWIMIVPAVGSLENYFLCCSKKFKIMELCLKYKFWGIVLFIIIVWIVIIYIIHKLWQPKSLQETVTRNN